MGLEVVARDDDPEEGILGDDQRNDGRADEDIDVEEREIGQGRQHARERELVRDCDEDHCERDIEPPLDIVSLEAKGAKRHQHK
eukprot:CAMPEP_0115838314 /NCGR_PEP_ID=MMETSP0287-20121206/5664_1 /TAXON_ID=412157 /ORGANISM="Chrysochromulina rotalis, Strain UIO044" /LENGTH=83 /DNA_ID=CAMNT_0003291835 /DNA_START=278 /DNA_END=529 /DNA_ORIENTATION=+